MTMSVTTTENGKMQTHDTRDRGGRPRDPAADHALLGATLALLEEDGYAGLTMAGVAKRAGVAATTLYRRWSSKEDLVAAAFLTVTTVLVHPDTGDLGEDLRIVLRQRAKALRGDEGRLLKGLMSELMNNPTIFAAFKQRLASSNLSIVAEILERAAARGEIPHLDLELALDVISGPFYTKMLAGDMPSDHYVDDIVPMLVAAIKATPSHRTRRSTRRPEQR
jgi:AcrR family transcriptional regulator